MQRLKDLAISETGFVFDPFSGATYTANGPALTILDGLKRGHTRAAIAAAVREAFEVGADDVLRDLDELLQTLRSFGLVAADQELA